MNVRMTRAVEIPAQARPTASPKPASRTGKAHWFLWDPTASSRHCRQARWCWFPSRFHTPTPAIPAGQRAGSPASTVVQTPTCVRIPHKPRTRPIRFTRLRRSQARGTRTWWPPKQGRFRYPCLVYEKGPPTTFPQVRGPLTHSVAGEGFEPSKLTRWIYRPWATTRWPAKTPSPTTTYVRIPHKQPVIVGHNRTPR